MATMTFECRTCGLPLRATGDSETPFVHEDGGDVVLRNAAVLAHMDEEDAKDEAVQQEV